MSTSRLCSIKNSEIKNKSKYGRYCIFKAVKILADKHGEIFLLMVYEQLHIVAAVIHKQVATPMRRR